MKFLIALVLLAGCSSDSATNNQNQITDTGRDSGLDQTTSSDVGSDALNDRADSEDATRDATQDVVEDATSDTQSDLPISEINFSVTNGAETFEFTEAYYGRNNDGSFYSEIYIGGTGDCPKMDDPAPDLTGIVVINPGGDSNLTLVNFAMLLGAEITYGATPTPNFNHEENGNLLSFDANFAFDTPGFSASGDFVAQHCPSLDEP